MKLLEAAESVLPLCICMLHNFSACCMILNICTLNELRPNLRFGVMHFMHAECMAVLVARGRDIKVTYA